VEEGNGIGRSEVIRVWVAIIGRDWWQWWTNCIARFKTVRGSRLQAIVTMETST